MTTIFALIPLSRSLGAARAIFSKRVEPDDSSIVGSAGS